MAAVGSLEDEAQQGGDGFALKWGEESGALRNEFVPPTFFGVAWAEEVDGEIGSEVVC